MVIFNSYVSHYQRVYIYHYIFMANVACNHVSTNFNRLKKLGSTTLGEKTGEESMSSFNSTLYALMTGDPARDIIPAPNSQAEGAGGRRRAPEGAGGRRRAPEVRSSNSEWILFLLVIVRYLYYIYIIIIYI